jgi:hypothetical protein
MRDALASGLRARAESHRANEFWSPKQAIRASPRSAGIRPGVGGGAVRVTTTALLAYQAPFATRHRDQREPDITGSLRIAEMADTFGLPVALVNCPGRYAAHIATVLPNHLMMEVVDVGRDVVFRTDHTIEDGEIVLGETPGIGITFDEQRLADHAVDRPSAETLGVSYRRSPDSGLAEPGIPSRARWADGT